MRLLTFIGLLTLVAGLGCQSAVSTTADRAEAVTPSKIRSETTTESDKNTAAKDDSRLSESGDEAPRILLADAKKAFDDGEAFFIDTRGSALFENEHLKGAVNIPTSDIENRHQELPRNKTIIVYCS